LYQVKHIISVLRHLGPYKEDVMKEFAPQQVGGNLNQRKELAAMHMNNTCAWWCRSLEFKLIAT
jgi:hypothetical protein